jgi:phage terminase small subunit
VALLSRPDVPASTIRGRGPSLADLEKIYGKSVIWRRWCEAYIRTGSVTAATSEVYGDSITAPACKGSRLLANREVQEILQEIMEISEATPDVAAGIIGEACKATKVVGETEVKDHQTRLRAADMILKVFDAYPHDEVNINTTSTSKHLHVYLAEPMKVQKFIVEKGRMPTVDERREIDGN